jgi:serine phosphatase RsbU (regulator of sigma subunit)
MQFYQQAEDPLGRQGALVFKAWIQYNKGDVLDAIENAENALQSLKDRESEWAESQRYQKILGNVYSDLGTYYKRVGESDRSIENTERSLEIRKKLGDLNDLAEIKMNLGRIFHDLKNYEEALKYYNESLEIIQNSTNISAVATIFSNRGQIYVDLEQWDLAEQDFMNGIEIRRKLGDKKGRANILRKLGDLFFMKKSFDKAFVSFRESEVVYREIQYDVGLAQSLLSLARLYEVKKDSSQMFNLGNQAYQISRNTNSIKVLLKCAEFIQPLYKHYGMLAEALAAAEDVQKAQQQIKEEEAKEIILKQAYQEKQAASKRYIYFLVAGAAILLIILFLVFRAYRMKRRASALMEREKMHVEEKNKNIVDSIQYAQQLQQAILPPIENIRQTFHEAFLIYWPKDIVAGDFYWLMEDDHYKLWAVADCTGHGVPGAMVSVVCSNALNRATKEKGLRVPGVILDEVRKLVIDTFKESQREVKDGMDIALCVYHKSTQTYQFAGANRPLWCLKKSGELIEIKGNKQAIGFQHQMEPFTTTPVPALHGDSIYLMTDGFVDQFGGPNAKKYMASRLKLKLSEIATQPFDLQKMNLEWEFNQWRGDQEQIDDVCLLAIKCF